MARTSTTDLTSAEVTVVQSLEPIGSALQQIRVNAGATSLEYFTAGGGTGDVSKVGTPVNNQVGVWTGDGTLEGDTALTFDTTTDTLATTLITATTVTANLVGNVTGNASGTAATVTGATQASITSAANLSTIGTITTGTWNATDIAVADGGTGRSTGTTAYSLIATGTTATGAQQTLANGATTEILVGGGASALPVWTTAQGSGAPVRATSPTLTTPNIGTPSAGVLTNCTGTATGLTSGITNALKSATTTVDVSAATAPTNGQVLTATSGTTATWQTPSASSSIPKCITSTCFEASGRFTSTLVSGGTSTFNTSGCTINTSATSTSSSSLYWKLSPQGNYMFTDAIFTCKFGITYGTDFQSFIGMSSNMVINGTSITYSGCNQAGFKMTRSASGTVNLIGTFCSGGSETTTSTLTTISSGDEIEVILQFTSTTNINYYWRKNNGNLSSSTALTISGNGPYQDCLYAICNSATATASNIVLSSSSYSR